MSTGTDIMFVLHHHGSMTKDEIGHVINEDAGTVGTRCSELFDEGVLMRREREQPHKRGPNPDEYAIAPVAHEWEVSEE